LSGDGPEGHRDRDKGSVNEIGKRMVYASERTQAWSKISPRVIEITGIFVRAGKESSTSIGDGVACLADN
jgi:hypothetical protein